jgi:Uma2 family endonuclease
VWILKVQDRQLEVYRHPKDDRYTEKQLLQPSDTLTLLAFPDVPIALSEVFISPET